MTPLLNPTYFLFLSLVFLLDVTLDSITVFASQQTDVDTAVGEKGKEMKRKIMIKKSDH